MSESTSITYYINNLNTLFSQLEATDYNVKQNECIDLLLQSLSNSHNLLIINFFLDFNYIEVAALQEESRRKSNEDRLFS